MDETAGERAAEVGRERVEPVGVEPVLEERVELAAKRLALFGVAREPDASRAPERVPGEGLHPVECPLGERPEGGCDVASERDPRLVVARRQPPESEAAVAAARTAGDLASLEQPDAKPAAGEC